MQKDLSKVLLVTDMDGTFLPKSKELSLKDMAEIARFRSDGGKFTVATGRALHAAKSYIDEIKPDFAAILYNGAVLWDYKTQQYTYSEFLPDSAKKIAQEILDKYSRIGCEVLCLDRVFVPKLNDVEAEHIKICNTKPQFCDLADIDCDIIKILFATQPSEQNELAEYCKKYDSVDFVKSEKHYFEMLSQNVTKGFGLKKLIETYKLQGYTVFACGDYDNDIEMIEAADFGFAVANAQDSVKKSADIVLKSSCEDCPMTEILNFIYNEWNGRKK